RPRWSRRSCHSSTARRRGRSPIEETGSCDSPILLGGARRRRLSTERVKRTHSDALVHRAATTRGTASEFEVLLPRPGGRGLKWRRRESNPRPKALAFPALHACPVLCRHPAGRTRAPSPPDHPLFISPG